MFVKRVCYPVQVLGPGNRIGIWLAGCNRQCPGCMSPELQSTVGCKNLSVDDVIVMLKKIKKKIDGVTISGGEPFIQANELSLLIEFIISNISEDIIVYTGFTIEELKKMRSDSVDKILSSISVLIDGEYVDELNDGKGIRGSSNQKIHYLKPGYEQIHLDDTERTLQTFRYNNQILVIGIQ